MLSRNKYCHGGWTFPAPENPTVAGLWSVPCGKMYEPFVDMPTPCQGNRFQLFRVAMKSPFANKIHRLQQNYRTSHAYCFAKTITINLQQIWRPYRPTNSIATIKSLCVNIITRPTLGYVWRVKRHEVKGAILIAKRPKVKGWIIQPRMIRQVYWSIV